jgi:membrane-associated phospholipid phosphatase
VSAPRASPGAGQAAAELACDPSEDNELGGLTGVIGRQRLAPPTLRRPGRQLPAQGQPPLPLLPASARRPAAILAVGCLVLVASLGVASAHQAHGFWIDQHVDSWVVLGLHLPLHALSLISRLGGVIEMTALTAALALACLAVRRVNGAVLAVVSVAVAAALTELVLKPLVHRTINGFLTYPSGHTTGLFALAAVIAVLLLSSPGGRPRSALRIAAVAAAVVVACAVGVAMIGMDFHYFTDTVGGAAVGTGVVIGVAFLLDLDGSRRRLARLRR